MFNSLAALSRSDVANECVDQLHLGGGEVVRRRGQHRLPQLYTYVGDIDLDGDIDGDDYFWIDSNINAAQGAGTL